MIFFDILFGDLNFGMIKSMKDVSRFEELKRKKKEIKKILKTKTKKKPINQSFDTLNSIRI